MRSESSRSNLAYRHNLAGTAVLYTGLPVLFLQIHRPEQTPTWLTLTYSGIAVVLILIGALVIRWIDRQRKQPFERLSASEELARYRKLFDEGEMTKEEFQLIRAHLGDRLRADHETVTNPGTEPHPADGPTLPASPPGGDGAVHPAQGEVNNNGDTETPRQPPENS